MKHTIIPALIFSVSLYSCAGGSNDKAPSAGPNTNFQIPAPVNPLQPTPANNQQPVVTPAPTTPVPAPVANASAAPNPAHGQPGHRCDIPVGAPLNSPPGQTATPPTNPAVSVQKNAPIITTSPATNVVTAPGMNPPHGQPGHRCDIAVGAPLNSKPADVPAKQEVVPAPVPVINPPKVDSQGHQ